MTIQVTSRGLQSTLQAGPRIGLRHLGVPAGGAADPLSLALANKLVSNAWDATAIEATLVGPNLHFEMACKFALTGGQVAATLDGDVVPMHATVAASPGSELVIGPVLTGARTYVAVAGGFAAENVLSSSSTNLQAAFGGHEGRALQSGDDLEVLGGDAPLLQAPAEFRLPVTASWGVRACESAEFGLLSPESMGALFDTNWEIGRRADRMGLRLDGVLLDISSDGRMPSAGVLPATIQCPEDGAPYVLSVDAGTVGGYPRIAQVARVDRHVLGQLRPGDHLRLLRRDPDEAIAELRAKIKYWQAWLPDIETILL